MTAIHQFLPTLASRDAIGGHALRVQEVLRSMGIDSEIFAEHVHPDSRGRARAYRDYRDGRRGDGPRWLLYQASTGTKMADWLLERGERLVLNYHNLTPVEFFAGWEPAVAAELKLGRKQLRRLRASTDLVIADSEYNAAEMVELGYDRTAVVPILFDPEAFGRERDDARFDALRAAKGGGGADLLFVGRLAPNKAQHDLVKLLAAYRALYDPDARLHLVGSSSSHAYSDTLHRFADALGLAGAVDFAGSVSEAELTAYFDTADVFVSVSEHEGFCVPLVEAMHHRVPIVAYGAAAVPETLGEAGLLLRSKDAATGAAAVHRVLSDDVLRAQLVAAATVRVECFSLRESRRKLVHAVEELVQVDQ
ncbi:MAG: glycosyltransferase [Acidimicrobiia bacterium]